MAPVKRSASSSTEIAPVEKKRRKNRNVIVSTSPFVCCNLTDLRCKTSNEFCDNSCRILVGEKYARKEDGLLCWKCFEKLEAGNKKSWKIKKNRSQRRESILTCKVCLDRYHLCCTSFVGTKPCRFKCHKCLAKSTTLKHTSREFNHAPVFLGAKRNQFEKFMEKKLNRFLKANVGRKYSEHPISVRSFKTKQSVKTIDVAPEFYKDHFLEKYPEEIEYVSRAIYIFQRIDGADVLFFTMFCMEFENFYDGKNWAVIDYLDSVQYFVYKDFRSKFYGEAILGYLEFAKSIGFTNAHLFSDPPGHKNDDFVFRVHPAKQKFLKPEILVNWYQRIFEKGLEDGTIFKVRTFKEEKIEDVKDLPLFVDGLWARVMKEIEEDLEKQKIELKNPQYKKEFEKAVKKKFKDNSKNNFFMDLYKKTPKKLKVNDPDEMNPNEILCDRQKFLERSKERKWEFSDFRRAKHTSLCIISFILNGA